MTVLATLMIRLCPDALALFYVYFSNTSDKFTATMFWPPFSYNCLSNFSDKSMRRSISFLLDNMAKILTKKNSNLLTFLVVWEIRLTYGCLFSNFRTATSEIYLFQNDLDSFY